MERYAHLKDATQNLNLPSVSVGANFTRLDQDVTLSGKQIVDSAGGIDPNLIASLSPSLLPLVTHLGAAKSTITERDIFTSSIRAIWPIFTGGRITAAQDAAAGKEEEAQSQLAMEIQARYEDLAKYYFSVVLAKEVLATRIAVEEGLTQHRDNALKLEQQGQIAHVERLQADASLDKAKVERKKHKNLGHCAKCANPNFRRYRNRRTEWHAVHQHQLTAHARLHRTNAQYLSRLKPARCQRKQASSLIKAEQGNTTQKSICMAIIACMKMTHSLAK